MRIIHGVWLVCFLSIATACSFSVSAASNNNTRSYAPSGHYLLIGGEAIPESYTLRDNWMYDGSDWVTSVALTAVIPPARTRSGMVMIYNHDQELQRLVLFGGQDGSHYFNDTWEYGNGSWEQLAASPAPSPRAGFGLAFDIDRQVIVLFGGYSGAENNQPDKAFTDTWEFDSATWRQVPTQHAPPASIGLAMAYDTARQRTVLVTGQQGPGYDWRNETWEYDGQDWVLAQPGPLGGVWRSSPCLAYDESRQRLVLFGGYHQGGAQRMLDDTWEYDGNQWHPSQAQGGPTPRCRCSMLYDSSKQKIVMFGGAADGIFLNDTWQLDGTEWIRVTTTTNPMGRMFASFGLLPD